MSKLKVVSTLMLALCACSRAGGPGMAPNASAFLPATAPRAPGYKTVFIFHGANGSGPDADLLNVKGTLYGTTLGGGNWSVQGGTLFTFSGGKERVLHSFGQPPDGSQPRGSLLEMKGTIYGTTYGGGKYGYGTVFRFDSSGKERVLHSFGSGEDGRQPVAGLTEVNGVLYGTTWFGGTHGGGIAFSITTAGREHVLHDFTSSNIHDGSEPLGGLTALRGKLYGTTSQGGGGGSCQGQGTVFSITTSGQERILYSFGCNRGDGTDPEAGLLAVNGVLYGTTGYGYYQQSSGTVFSITPTGKERLLYSFQQAQGAEPDTSLVFSSGVLYGATYSGGTYNNGVAFGVELNGHGKVLHSFGAPGDGSNPSAGMTNVKGTLYGTTINGNGYLNAGTIYAIAP